MQVPEPNFVAGFRIRRKRAVPCRPEWSARDSRSVDPFDRTTSTNRRESGVVVSLQGACQLFGVTPFKCPLRSIMGTPRVTSLPFQLVSARSPIQPARDRLSAQTLWAARWQHYTGLNQHILSSNALRLTQRDAAIGKYRYRSGKPPETAAFRKETCPEIPCFDVTVGRDNLPVFQLRNVRKVFVNSGHTPSGDLDKHGSAATGADPERDHTGSDTTSARAGTWTSSRRSPCPPS